MLLVANGHVACSHGRNGVIPSVKIALSATNFGSISAVVVIPDYCAVRGHFVL